MIKVKEVTADLVEFYVVWVLLVCPQSSVTT